MAGRRPRASVVPALQELGRAIWARRYELGMTQEDAAWACRLGRAHFGAVERGECSPTYLTLLEIARGLDLEPDVLLRRAKGRDT